jgi:hypothetical protein
MTNPWVCIDCGARQEDKGSCRACGHEDTLDARVENVRDLMRDVDLRLADRRESRLRFLGVGIGMAIIFALWTVPGYWGLRGTIYPGLPLFIDQWALMAIIAFGVIKGGEKLFFKKRFPYLNADHTIS